MDLNIKNILGSLELKFLLEIDEIRLRVNKPLMVCRSNEDFLINKNGKIVKSVDQAFIVRECEIYNSLQLLSQYSLYSIEEELSKGFITLKGGHRVGITGKAIIEKGNIKTIKYVNGLNYRIMREVKGCSQKISKIIRKDSKDLFHTLIAGPPKTGKTTILRDLVRRFSTGDEQYPGLKIGVVDERSEIAGCHRGIPQNDVGIRTDVLDCCPKAQGIINLIRSMSPEVIVTDEIGSKEDLVSIHEALSAGIKIITTVHGANIEELLNRPYISQMIRDRLFEKIIFLDNSKGVGTISSVVDVKDIIRIGIENVS
ncbi:stage III sporulation protein AA [Alkalibaculum sp. M08DMB]|uniref:Stage III sporulation protein AA n=2 Tax=Alkalibaculum sporogenes TaxID=2655001 RepID=A0A6A7K6S6_9FIRM|nr:stage III sporulation protein AA [Alkalibaculum sporogenes]